VERQAGESRPFWFSFYARDEHPRQLPCYITWAGSEVKEIISRHLTESALYGGAISGRGPRYCPSIEDKVVKFPQAERHQVFLEPEGLDTSEMYVNGLSTSLPPEVQLTFLRSVPGLERVKMTRPGYAIEYDYFPPTQLAPTLEVKELPGLFLAGQVNGTTGYEEAAGQGVLAGINAAHAALGREEIILRRDEAMVGVLVDDLVQRGVDEPYRLFTSRAEYRLLLRQDNALRRLGDLAQRLGLLTEVEQRTMDGRLELEERVEAAARATTLPPDLANPILASTDSSPVSEPTKLADLAKRPGISLHALMDAAGFDFSREEVEWAAIELRYEGYLARERDAAERLAKMDHFELPTEMAYRPLSSLSFEAREKLEIVRPRTLGHASRIPGVSPSDLQSLVVEVMRWRKQAASTTG
jgi:tRNA uridine 5-carboxymethylaminomethyl modification enzyme